MSFLGEKAVTEFLLSGHKNGVLGLVSSLLISFGELFDVNFIQIYFNSTIKCLSSVNVDSCCMYFEIYKLLKQ